MKLEGYIELFLRQYHHLSLPGIGMIHRIFRDAYLDHRVQTAYPGEESFAYTADMGHSTAPFEEWLLAKAGPDMLQEWHKSTESWKWSWDESGTFDIPGLLRLINREGQVEVDMLASHGLGNWYGLPAIPFYALNRELAIERMALPKPKLPSGYKAEPYSFNKEILAPILATLLVLVAYAMIFTWPGNRVEGPPSRSTSFEVDQSNVNRSPVLEDSLESMEDDFFNDEERIDRAIPDQPLPEDSMPEEQLPDEEGFEDEMILNSDTPVIEQVPEEALTKECIVIVGAFRKKSNVDRMVSKLTELGYDVYQESGPSGLTRVGARLECLNEEVLDTLSFFRNRFVEDAWVLKW